MKETASESTESPRERVQEREFKREREREFKRERERERERESSRERVQERERGVKRTVLFVVESGGTTGADGCVDHVDGDVRNKVSELIVLSRVSGLEDRVEGCGAVALREEVRLVAVVAARRRDALWREGGDAGEVGEKCHQHGGEENNQRVRLHSFGVCGRSAWKKGERISVWARSKGGRRREEEGGRKKERPKRRSVVVLCCDEMEGKEWRKKV